MQTKTVCLFFYIPYIYTYSAGLLFPSLGGSTEGAFWSGCHQTGVPLAVSQQGRSGHTHDAMSLGAGRLLSCNLAASLVISMIDAFYGFIASSEFPWLVCVFLGFPFPLFLPWKPKETKGNQRKIIESTQSQTKGNQRKSKDTKSKILYIYI